MTYYKEKKKKQQKPICSLFSVLSLSNIHLVCLQFLFTYSDKSSLSRSRKRRSVLPVCITLFYSDVSNLTNMTFMWAPTACTNVIALTATIIVWDLNVIFTHVQNRTWMGRNNQKLLAATMERYLSDISYQKNIKNCFRIPLIPYNAQLFRNTEDAFVKPV